MVGYLLHTPIWRLQKKANVDRKVRMKIAMVRGMERLYIGTYNRFRKRLAMCARIAGPGRVEGASLPVSSITNCVVRRAHARR